MRERLLAAFEVSERDLAENRAGRLTDAQAKHVRSATSGDALFMSGFAVICAVVLYGLLYLLVSDGRVLSSAELLPTIVILLVTLVLPTAAIGWAAWTWIVHLRTRPEVQRVAGAAELSVLSRRGLSIHQVTVGGRTFVIMPRVYELLVSGETYEVFYVPVADVVVAIVPS